MVKPTFIYLNPVELKYYPFMISLVNVLEVAMSYLQKICVPKEIKDINVKTFNMITNKNEAKTMTKHISCKSKCKFNSTTCNLNRKLNNRTCQCECKNYHKCKKMIVGILAHVFVKIESIAYISVIERDQIIIVMDIVSTKLTNAIATIVTCTASIIV